MWTSISEAKPHIDFIYKGEYGYEVVAVKLEDGRECSAEYSFQCMKDDNGVPTEEPHNFWMVMIDPNEEDGTYYWAEDMTIEEYPERIPVIAWHYL